LNIWCALGIMFASGLIVLRLARTAKFLAIQHVTGRPD
jgi:hypothetical protein